MPSSIQQRSVGLGLLLFSMALAPASSHQAQQPPPAPPEPARAVMTPADLARSRAELGAQAYDTAWLYYSENRIDSDTVYRWSRRAWEAARDAATDQVGRVAAAEVHLERMVKLEAKIAKIRRLGFGNSLDVAGVEFFRREAEFWLASARAQGSGPP